MPDSAATSTSVTLDEDSVSTDLHDHTRESDASRDWLLSVVMDLTLGLRDEKVDASFGVTLMVRGLLVSGLVISRDEWIANTVDSIAEESRIPADRVNAIWHTITKSAEDLRVENALSGLHSDPRKFIHLKDVRVHSPSGVQRAPLWRGALDRVDGWSLGLPVPA
jgi:hypothetical protein